MFKAYTKLPKAERALINEQIQSIKGKKSLDASFLEMPTGHKEYIDSTCPENN